MQMPWLDVSGRFPVWGAGFLRGVVPGRLSSTDLICFYSWAEGLQDVLTSPHFHVLTSERLSHNLSNLASMDGKGKYLWVIAQQISRWVWSMSQSFYRQRYHCCNIHWRWMCSINPSFKGTMPTTHKTLPKFISREETYIIRSRPTFWLLIQVYTWIFFIFLGWWCYIQLCANVCTPIRTKITDLLYKQGM